MAKQPHEGGKLRCWIGTLLSFLLDVLLKIEKLISLSLSNGKTVGLGQPHPGTLKFLKEKALKMKEKGIEIFLLSMVLE
jgi:polysaccharide deacetylase 2 family uncharacterized protein YibQ